MHLVPDPVHAPDADDDIEAIMSFALTYNGYTRLADHPEALLRVVEPVIDHLRREGKAPAWAGLDLLRGALFYLQRESRHGSTNSILNESEMRGLTRAIGQLAGDLDLPNDLGAPPSSEGANGVEADDPTTSGVAGERRVRRTARTPEQIMASPTPDRYGWSADQPLHRLSEGDSMRQTPPAD